MSKKIIVKSLEYPEDVEDLISKNKDIEISDELIETLSTTEPTQLLDVTKEMGSHPIKIKSIKPYTETGFLKNF